MQRRTKLAVGSVLVLSAAAAGLLAFANLGGAQGSQAISPRGNFSVAQAHAFTEFPVFNVGDSFEGLPLSAVLRRDTTGSGPVPTNYVSFIYGDCVVESDTGCTPPAEVQVWPACVRNLALYDPAVAGTPTPDNRTVRSVPGAYFEGGQRLEIQTGRSTIVIFGDSPDRVGRMAAALRGVNLPVGATDALPAPAAGAVAGKLPC